MNSHFTAGFGDELIKMGGLLDILNPGKSLDEKSYSVVEEGARRAGRGAMRNVGLDPDKASHKALVAGAVGVPAAMVATAPFRASANKRRIRRLEREMAAMKSKRGVRGMAGTIMKALRRGR